MISSDLRSLVNKLNGLTTQCLYEASGLAVSRTNYEVAVEHLLLKALDERYSDLSLIATHFKVNTEALRQNLNHSLTNFNSGNTARPTFSPILMDLLEASWVVASVDLGLKAVRTGAIVIAFLRRSSLYAQGGPISELAKISREELEKNFSSITSQSAENAQEIADSTDSSQAAVAGAGESFVAKFCENFSQKAALGKIDPVFGRDVEIRSMVNILARRRKNNPILVGEPGVGKTAVIEGLAKRIYEGDVPETLKGVTLLALDMGLLEAGASMKGEFERRLKGVIDEIRSSANPIILFIDEAHMLVGAGGSQGGADAANLLKPVLARGELKTCAATTWKEYKKYFEKDPALARRFQPVTLDEPDVETCVVILRGLKDYYEKSHKVQIRDGALRAAAEMSNRYISGRFLPDKAVDLLDTACAQVKVGLVAKPPLLEDSQRAVAALMREKDGLERDSLSEPTVDSDRVQVIDSEIEALNEKIAELTTSWEKQKEAAQAFIAARSEYLASDGSASISQAQLEDAKSAYRATATEDGLIDVEVTAEVVAQVVSDWTGIPVGRIASEQAKMVGELESILTARIKGQEAAIASIVEVIEASKAGLKDPAQPMGVFLLCGPSGVGKTETALVLAESLFGDEKSVVTINMSEFQEKHTVSRLVGSPPGYVGYGEGGILTEAVRQKPYCVVLLDEVEKAHLDVMNLFYQVFDKGILTDSEGKKVSFANTVIIMTSNLAANLIEAAQEADSDANQDTLLKAIRPTLSEHFLPALLARMNVIPFRQLDALSIKLIAGLKLETLKKRLFKNNGVDLLYDSNVIDAVAARCLISETGARNIDSLISSAIMPVMAKQILSRMSKGSLMPKTITILPINQEFKIIFDDKAAPSTKALAIAGPAPNDSSPSAEDEDKTEDEDKQSQSIS
ncbi:MAG: type VI secretion system ATPase TssH [Deltaproteobacteria bacterium]|jgi:type VI secretion system protein VasG|nr:type VI secretion system ATPase TssH [Deltaproteobacteria bacterium]